VRGGKEGPFELGRLGRESVYGLLSAAVPLYGRSEDKGSERAGKRSRDEEDGREEGRTGERARSGR
jgi:hypothetical protein